jgi:hypothetical protein
MKVFNAGDSLRSQISSVMVADEIMKDLREVKKEKLTRLDKEIEYYKVFE